MVISNTSKIRHVNVLAISKWRLFGISEKRINPNNHKEDMKGAEK